MASHASPDPLRKCARCSFPIQLSEERVVYDRGDWLHPSCWQILESAEQVRGSRRAAAASRQHIDTSLARIARTSRLLDHTAVLCVRCGTGIRARGELTVTPEGPAHNACPPLA